jgi:multidrug resistance efflux pump
MPDEKELLTKLAEAEKELHGARNSLADAKRKWTAAETNVISAKIYLDRVKEELRVYRNTTPKYEPSAQDLDLERFRRDNHELMQWIRERDKKDEPE